jgi:hypothetical protein
VALYFILISILAIIGMALTPAAAGL